MAESNRKVYLAMSLVGTMMSEKRALGGMSASAKVLSHGTQPSPALLSVQS